MDNTLKQNYSRSGKFFQTKLISQDRMDDFNLWNLFPSEPEYSFGQTGIKPSQNWSM